MITKSSYFDNLLSCFKF